MDHAERLFGDSRLVLDNNIAEWPVRPFAIVRKSWLYFGSDDGRLAVLASFSTTCQFESATKCREEPIFSSHPDAGRPQLLNGPDSRD